MVTVENGKGCFGVLSMFFSKECFIEEVKVEE